MSKKHKDIQRSVLSSEFVQFLGGTVSKMCSKGGAFEGRPQAAAHETIAVVTEELLRLTYDKDGDIDFFRAKPIIRAAIFLVNQYQKEIGLADINESLKKKTLARCATAISLLQTMTNLEEDFDGGD